MRMILESSIWRTDMPVAVTVMTTSLETPFWTEFCYSVFSFAVG